MLRVVHVCQPADGGVAGYVVRLAADQVARGWQVTVICPPELAGQVRATGAAGLSWPAHRNPARAVLHDIGPLRAQLSGTGADVVHLHSSSAGLSGRLVLRGRTPTLFTPHGWSWLPLGAAAAAAARRWERLATRWTRSVLCVSEAERSAGIAAGVRGPLVVVRNGVDLARFPPAADEERARLKADLGFGEQPLVVCVGRWARQKGQDLLLAAWPTVRREFPGARLALVGADRSAAGADDRSTEGVSFVAVQRDVRPWYAAADVAVFPSRWEGLSLALLEAAAVGSSIVATDVAGVREVLGDGERGGVVGADALALAGAVADRLRDSSLRRREQAATAAFAAAHLDQRRSWETLAVLTAEAARR